MGWPSLRGHHSYFPASTDSLKSLVAIVPRLGRLHGKVWKQSAHLRVRGVLRRINDLAWVQPYRPHELYVGPRSRRRLFLPHGVARGRVTGADMKGVRHTEGPLYEATT